MSETLCPPSPNHFYIDGFCVFQDVPDSECKGWMWPLRLQKRGFRHVAWIQERGQGWTMTQSLSGRLETSWFPESVTGNYPARLGEQGANVVRVVGWRPLVRPRPEILNCVTVVKRIVGLQDWRVVSPFQLFEAVGG